MKDRMERLVVLPFSMGMMGMGCSSQSSVAVYENNPKKSKQEPNQLAIRGDEEDRLSGEKMKNSSLAFLPPKPSISSGLQKFVKGFKSFSQLFVYKDEGEELEMDMDMEIGFPTDVKHVTHIGWDGSTTNNPLKGWDNLKPPELVSLPSFSLRQFELSMASQADAPVC